MLDIGGVEGQLGKDLVQILATVIFLALLLELSLWISRAVVGKSLEQIILEGKRGLSHVAVPVLRTGRRIKVVKVIVEIVCLCLKVKDSLHVSHLQHFLVGRRRYFYI